MLEQLSEFFCSKSSYTIEGLIVQGGKISGSFFQRAFKNATIPCQETLHRYTSIREMDVTHFKCFDTFFECVKGNYMSMIPVLAMLGMTCAGVYAIKQFYFSDNEAKDNPRRHVANP